MAARTAVSTISENHIETVVHHRVDDGQRHTVKTGGGSTRKGRASLPQRTTLPTTEEDDTGDDAAQIAEDDGLIPPKWYG